MQVLSGCCELVSFLLSKHPTVCHKKGQPCLAQTAAEAGLVDVLQTIHSAEPRMLRERGDDGGTAAHRAAAAGKVHVIKAMIEMDPVCGRFFIPDVCCFLRCSVANIGPLPDWGSLNMKHQTPNTKHETLKTNPSSAQTLMEDRLPDGNTPAHIAAVRGYFEVVSAIHAHDAFLLSQTNDLGETVPHCAVIGTHLKAVVSLSLLDPGFPTLLYTRNNLGETPGHSAARAASHEILEALHAASPLILSERDLQVLSQPLVLHAASPLIPRGLSPLQKLSFHSCHARRVPSGPVGAGHVSPSARLAPAPALAGATAEALVASHVWHGLALSHPSGGFPSGVVLPCSVS